MATLASYLSQSAAVRPTVQAAINNVQNCSESPSNAEATIQQAITTRQSILQGLQTLSVSGLPNGTQLVSALTAAMQNSLNADNDYHAWMADLVSSGNTCGSNAEPGLQLRERRDCLQRRDDLQECLPDPVEPDGAHLRAADVYGHRLLMHRLAWTLPVLAAILSGCSLVPSASQPTASTPAPQASASASATHSAAATDRGSRRVAGPGVEP